MKKIINFAVVFALGLFLIGACTQQKPEDLVGKGSEVAQPPTQVQESSAGSQVKEYNITAKNFLFEPSVIEVNNGDRVRLIVTSIDVPHGIAIKEYGINKRLDPGKPVTIEFTADKSGNFTTFCSVFCGEGHSGMKGKLIVH